MISWLVIKNDETSYIPNTTQDLIIKNQIYINFCAMYKPELFFLLSFQPKDQSH